MSWQKNQSGNPKGRKRLSEEEKQQKEYFLKMLKSSVPEALGVLLEIMNNKDALNRDRLSCARVILERAYGSEPLLLNAEDEDNIVEIRIIREGKKTDEAVTTVSEWEAVIEETEKEVV